MTKPTKPAAVDGPTLDDAADAQLFSSKTFAWVEYTPLAVQFFADSNDFVELLASEVDADAMATEAGRAQAVQKAGEAAYSESQALLHANAAGAASPIDLAASNIGDLLQVIDVGGGVKGLAMSAARFENFTVPVGTTPTVLMHGIQGIKMTLTGNTVFNLDFADVPSGVMKFFIVELTQAATVYSPTFTATDNAAAAGVVEFVDATIPANPAANERATYYGYTMDGGATVSIGLTTGAWG